MHHLKSAGDRRNLHTDRRKRSRSGRRSTDPKPPWTRAEIELAAQLDRIEKLTALFFRAAPLSQEAHRLAALLTAELSADERHTGRPE
jgi:hypothetical protein